MSKVKDRLLKEIEEKFGPDAPVVIEYLFDAGTLDDCLARRHVIRSEMYSRLTNPRLLKFSKRRIEEDLAEDFGLTRSCIFQISVGK
jgi:hypothetical protein